MIEAMKQAAEDVSKAYDVLAFAHTERALELLAKTRTSLRQAIAELESQEPVCPECKAEVLYECVACSRNNYPPQRTWVGLTDEEVADIERNSITRRQAIRAIEAKLKEKNT